MNSPNAAFHDIFYAKLHANFLEVNCLAFGTHAHNMDMTKKEKPDRSKSDGSPPLGTD